MGKDIAKYNITLKCGHIRRGEKKPKKELKDGYYCVKCDDFFEAVDFERRRY